MNDASSISISQNLNIIREQISNAEIEFGRSPGSVKLLAVSKTRPVEDLQAAINAGQLLFGENYLQDALPKIEVLPGNLEWHFIGPIQSNKTQPVAQHFDWVHSIDRLKIARRISEQRPATLEPMNICLQVNTSGEASKSGIEPEETLALAKQITRLPGIQLRGLMTIPASEEDFELQRQPFRLLAELQQQLIKEGLPLDTLSMGMTNDMRAAIAEGATIVRIGTAIFGARQH